MPIPEPGPGQVLVRIEACGLCHTDIHAAHGDWPVKPTPPFIPGHEGVGIVESARARASPIASGRRPGRDRRGSDTPAGTAATASAAGRRSASQQQNTGYSIDGGFAEFAVADADYVVAVPEGVSPQDAAPLTCAGVTTYKADQGRRASGPPSGSRSSASAASATSPCSTRASSAAP